MLARRFGNDTSLEKLQPSALAAEQPNSSMTVSPQEQVPSQPKLQPVSPLASSEKPSPAPSVFDDEDSQMP